MQKSLKHTSEDRTALFDHYRRAKDWLRNSCHKEDMVWQDPRSIREITEQIFLREYAWVILNSGFKEDVVRKHFRYISLCFCDWESAAEIATNAAVCMASAWPVFRNRRKLEAIVQTAYYINQTGFAVFKVEIERDPLSAVCTLPYVGDVTKWHLARNLGANVAKPDRHLLRVAARFGYGDVNAMCREIAAETGDRIGLADIVLWRYEKSASGQQSPSPRRRRSCNRH